MSEYYYFYKDITKDNKWYRWNCVDSGSYTGIPYVEKYGCKLLKPLCEGCVYKKQNENKDWMVQRLCCECWDQHNTYCVTKSQAKRIQADMKYNKTLFTDLMDKMGQNWIWIRYS